MTTIADLMSKAIVAEMAGRRGFAWDERTARYRNLETGRYVSESTVRNFGQAWLDRSVERNIQDITQRHLDGSLDLADWQRRMAQEIRDAAIVEASLGRGGRDQMTQSDWGRVGARLREQYAHLNQFAADIKAGRLSNAQIAQRARMYAQAARTSYYDGLTSAKASAGFTEEMRVLGAAEHCTDCPPLAGRWAPIGSLPAIGATQCMVNCRCTKRYRKTVIDEKGNVSYVEA